VLAFGDIAPISSTLKGRLVLPIEMVGPDRIELSTNWLKAEGLHQTAQTDASVSMT